MEDWYISLLPWVIVFLSLVYIWRIISLIISDIIGERKLEKKHKTLECYRRRLPALRKKDEEEAKARAESAEFREKILNARFKR